MKFRLDQDSLGKVKIPSDAYYGAFTGRAIKQYNVTGHKAHENLIKSFVMIKRSAAVANMKVKALDRKRGTAIVQARWKRNLAPTIKPGLWLQSSRRHPKKCDIDF